MPKSFKEIYSALGMAVSFLRQTRENLNNVDPRVRLTVGEVNDLWSLLRECTDDLKASGEKIKEYESIAVEEKVYEVAK